MTVPSSIESILQTYKKYGWILRRIIVAKGYDPAPDDENVEVTDGSVNAAWFSRPPANGPVAWEIRYLGEPPFALLESLDETDPDFESRLKAVEERLAAAVLSRLDKSSA